MAEQPNPKQAFLIRQAIAEARCRRDRTTVGEKLRTPSMNGNPT